MGCWELAILGCEGEEAVAQHAQEKLWLPLEVSEARLDTKRVEGVPGMAERGMEWDLSSVPTQPTVGSCALHFSHLLFLRDTAGKFQAG